MEIYDRFAWCMVAIAAFFSLAVLPPLQATFYPQQVSLKIRLAAPTLFGLLAAACFAGIGFWALMLTILIGSRLVFAFREPN